MNMLFHIFISRTLKAMMIEKFAVSLNEPAFVFGSIKPDLFPSLITIPHEIKYSKDFIRNEMDILLNNVEILGDKFSWAFSEKLGVITHFIADYFCHAHSDKYNGNSIQHFFYEFKHLKYLLRNVWGLIEKQDKITSLCMDIDLIDMYLDEQYEKYTTKTPTPALDMIYSIKLTSTYCFSIIKTCCDQKEFLNTNLLKTIC